MLRALAMAGLLLALVLTGCETPEATEAARHDRLVAAGEDAAAAGLFHLDARLYRRDPDGGWDRDHDHVFTNGADRRVRARVALQNVRPDRTYSVHLVWVRPDGRELFRRYAEVTRQRVVLPAGVVPDSTGALPARFVGRLQRRYGQERGGEIATRLAAAPAETVLVNLRHYKDAVDLADANLLVRLEEDPQLRVYSHLDIAPDRDRDLGEYRLRVYLDRVLLREIPFTLRAEG
jgi:hypothetical protein